MAEALLEIAELSKSFRSHWTFRATPAVHNVSFVVNRGEAFGFLGHNGAGKTTTIKCILGLIKSSSGSILLHGKSLGESEQRQAVGYLPEQPYFYDHLSVEETLDFYAALYGIPNPKRRDAVRRTLELVELGDRRRSSVRSLSKGLQQRLGLAQAIINEPKLLLLDEPFSGLDPFGRMKFREILLELKARGTTILLSSHILSDVEEICDRVAIMAQGTIQRVFELKDAAALFGERYELEVAEVALGSPLFLELKHLSITQAPAIAHPTGSQTFEFASQAVAQQALEMAMHAGAVICRFSARARKLEDIFISVTTQARQAQGKETKLPVSPNAEPRV